MGTTQDHRRLAEECVAKASRSDHESDKALWLSLAQSWMRLAEHVARGGVEPPERRRAAVHLVETTSADQD